MTELCCQYCCRANFTSKRGLSQHLLGNKSCNSKAKADVFTGIHPQKITGKVEEFLISVELHRDLRRLKHLVQKGTIANIPPKSTQTLDPFKTNRTYNTLEEYDDDIDGNYHQIGPFAGDDSSEDEYMSDNAPNYDDDGTIYGLPDIDVLGNFKTFCRKPGHDFWETLRDKEQNAIKLLHELRQTKASLDTYDTIMAWHLRCGGKLRDHEDLASCSHYISQKSLYKNLSIRYNLQKGKDYNLIKEITLPGTRSKARIVMNDARAMLQSLLTDPRILDEDYLFFNGDPFSPPPGQLNYVRDLNTGQAYIETWHKLITIPGKQVLLPVVFYIDGAATGQFSALNVTAVKFSLGIFTRKAREKVHLWRTLGYLPPISKNKSRGRRILLESGHVDGTNLRGRTTEGEGTLHGQKVHVSQDMHTMLAEILDGFLKIQETGFVWDLYYRGKLYKGIEFVLFVPFIRCDTEEADRLCGKYTARTGNVSQLCRYCECPTDVSDDPFANYPRKTVPGISALIASGDTAQLKNLSQQNLNNSMYLLRFGQHNDEGVHGACPMEMLHALSLGLFKYTRDCFFEQIGSTSKTADEINALSVEYGHLFCRQSERDMPKTKFSNGIRRGKLMGKEYTGVLLILAAVLQSSQGKRILSDKKYKGPLSEEDHRTDWMMLIETLLQWEQWLKSEEMALSDVQRAQKKHRHILYLMKKIGNRSKGMGLKIIKYHGVIHVYLDIIRFGVPSEVDTSANEAGHKPTKTASRLTQKREELHDEQTNQRLMECHLIDLAMEEINGRPVWDYAYGYRRDGQKQVQELPKRLGGCQYGVEFVAENDRYEMHLVSKIKGEDTMYVEQCFVDFLGNLERKLERFGMKKLVIYTNHHRNGLLFRGSAQHSGEVWRDWVSVRWEGHGDLPAKIWGFVDLSKLPDNNDLKYGGLEGVSPGYYAVIETAEWNDTEENTSELFRPIIKQVGKMERGYVKKLRFFLADCESFVEPLVIIPDVGGPTNAYFACKPKKHWREDFINWLQSEDENDSFYEGEIVNQGDDNWDDSSSIDSDDA